MNPNSKIKFQNIGLPEDILRMKHHGDYENAIKLIDIRMQDTNLPKSLRCCLEIHREMMVRMALEFPYTYSEALSIIREHIPDFTKEECRKQYENSNNYSRTECSAGNGCKNACKQG